MKKIKEKYLSEVGKIVHKIMDSLDFVFKAPAKITRVFRHSVDTEIDWEVIDKYAKQICSKIKENDRYVEKNFTISDRGSTIFDMMPMPIPNIHVMTDKEIFRYSGMIFGIPEGILISLSRITYSENGKEIAGVDISKKEEKLIRDLKAIVGCKMLRNPITIIKESKPQFYSSDNFWDYEEFSSERLEKAVSNISAPVLFADIHCWIASLMPYIKESAKPFYYPALRLSENSAAAELQLETLRNTLSDYTFKQNDTECSLPIPELTIQNSKGIETLDSVSGVPVIVRLEYNAEQIKLTEEMQRAYYSFCALGIARHPFATCPIMIGDKLPAENTLLAINWKTSDAVNTEDARVLSATIINMFFDTKQLADEFTIHMSNLHLNNGKYSTGYLLRAASFFDKKIFSGDGEGVFFQRMKECVSAIKTQEEEQVARFQRAANILKDITQLEDIIADDAKSMSVDHLGFRYSPNGSPAQIAFELNDDFVSLITMRLGLQESDSEAFRKFLRDNGMIDKLSKTVRGRSGEAVSHVLIRLCS